jgi:hypothetical protein
MQLYSSKHSRAVSDASRHGRFSYFNALTVPKSFLRCSSDINDSQSHRMPPPFNKSVFVNCPFDPQYLLFYQTIVFTIQYLNLECRSSYERSDAGEPRIQKLVELISRSKYGVHDLSRCRAKEAGEYYRFNMPLELGLDLGCRQFGIGNQRRKRILVLDARLYRLQKAISDIAGSDIKAHRNNQLTLIRAVSGWLIQTARVGARSATEISGMYLRFTEDNFERLQSRNYSLKDIREQPQHEIRNAMKRWIVRNKPRRAGGLV